jgi:ATP-dependent Lhr-like helicase
MPLDSFHPLIRQWFQGRFTGPTDPQTRGWPAIQSGQSTLIAAPTGSGKTLAAFLTCIDSLFRQSIDGALTDSTQVVYISPLKALSNDVRRNLQTPLEEIHDLALAAGHQLAPIRVGLRTGDTPPSERQAQLRRPPHILVTTPESLYLVLTSSRSRENLRSVHTVIVDEIHALAPNKRGSHLALTLARLDAICDRPPVRIGLSATQRPLSEIARFLVGTHRVGQAGEPDCNIVDGGHVRQLDLAIDIPPSELSAVCSNEQWAEVYHRLAELISQHRSTLVFVNTRRLAERVAHQLSQLLGEDAVASHHGSLSRHLRLSAEERLKSGQLRAIVATASLELGIDIGYIDLVCQIGSPRSIATLLQRIGRSGHSLGATPKGRLFPLSRDGLLECLAIQTAVRAGRLDTIEIPLAPLDILAQQIVAAVACDDWDETELYDLCRAAWPYRDLTRERFESIVRLLSEGLAPGRRNGAYLHRDLINRRLRARRSARLAAITSGGAIPEQADFRVITEGEDLTVGAVNEDFALESMAGDIFLLGNSSWRIRYVRGSDVVVQDAHGLPASIPFWLGEGPGRTPELSTELANLRDQIAARLTSSPEDANHLDAAAGWLEQLGSISPSAARQAASYVASQRAAVGMIPNQRQILFERFFDESGGMQLVIHAPFGARINRAWGLAMRKRFCRSFNFELQAAADDNGIVLSLGPQHSFPLDQMFGMLNPQNAHELLVQALLAAPMFLVRWRWNVTRALAVLRHQSGRRVPPQLQRFRADDLLSAVFPETTGCLENHVGDLEVPDHPIVEQTVYDCLHEVMDFDRWHSILSDRAAGQIEFVARDTREPSPFCYELLNANPYAFLDDAPLEERRTRAVSTRRTLAPSDVNDLGRLDPAAIAEVVRQAWPDVRSPDELHDTLLALGGLPVEEGHLVGWADWFSLLVDQGRATTLRRSEASPLWIAAERVPWWRALAPQSRFDPEITLPAELDQPAETIAAHLAIVRGQLEARGPITATAISEQLGLRPTAVDAACEALEGEGFALRGRFHPDHSAHDSPQWCERRLLARIHRLTLDQLRRQVQPVSTADFWRFLVAHQHASPSTQRTGTRGLAHILAQLQGFESPAGAWETQILPTRLRDYDSGWLDSLTLEGQILWGRLQPPRRGDEEVKSRQQLTRVAPISLLERQSLAWLLPPERTAELTRCNPDAQQVWQALVDHGALFFDDLSASTGLLPTQVEVALGELAAAGLVSADGFSAIRQLVGDSLGRRNATGRVARQRRTPRRTTQRGRWSKFPPFAPKEPVKDRNERWARLLLSRYGVMFRDMLGRESVAPPWSELVPIYRRLEARGEIRGGRFVAGVAGEQFALGSAIEALRRTRDHQDEEIVILSAADPLNLMGILDDHPRLPPHRNSAFALCRGQVVAIQQAGEVTSFLPLNGQTADVQRALRQTAIARQRATAAPLPWLAPPPLSLPST